MAETKAYAIKDREGEIIPNSARLKEDVCKLMFRHSAELGFDYYEREGFSCVPVLITEVKK